MMKQPPLIVVSPDIAAQGAEFQDLSISLSWNYQRAIINAGGIPLAMPATTSREVIAECVRCADGVLLTGGWDIAAGLAAPRPSKKLRATVQVTPDGGARDLREFMLVEEIFRQRKPLLGICRGHQVLNVALGGTLLLDIPSQMQTPLAHRQMERKCEIVHDVRLTPGSMLHKMVRAQTMGVNSTHHQAVDRIAGLLRVVASSTDGVAEGLELKPEQAGRVPFLLSVQWHPERLADRYRPHRAIFTAFVRACAANRTASL